MDYSEHHKQDIFSNLAIFENLTGKIGILGGSFDPVHKGHIEAILSLKKQLQLSNCILIPTNKNPLKQSSPLASNQDRLAMLHLATKDLDGILISDIELRNDKQDVPSYTIDTLRKIKNFVKDRCTLFFLIGSDLVPSLNEWKDVELISQYAKIIPYSRAGYVCSNDDLNRYNLPQVLNVPEINISATQIRLALKNKLDIKELIPENILQYILENNLYIND